MNKMNMSHSLLVLYDEGYNIMDLLWQDIIGQSDFHVQFEPLAAYNESTARQQLDSLKIRKPVVQNILLLASSSNVAKYFAEAAIEHKEAIFDWTVLTMDLRPFDCDACSDVSFTFVQPEEGINFRLNRDFKEYLRGKSNNDELATSDRELEASFYHDMVYFIWEYMRQVNESTIDPEAFMFGCNGNQSMTTSNTTSVTLTEFFDRSPEGGFGPYVKDYDKPKVYFQNIICRIVDINYKSLDFNQIQAKKEVGNWTIINGIETQYAVLNPDFSHIQHYRVATLQQPPFVQRCDPGPCSNGLEFEGYCIDIFEELSHMFDFTYDMYEVMDKQTGFLNDNEEWSGLIADLLAGKAEIAVAPVSVTAQRQDAVEFTVPYYTLVGITILMKKDEIDTDLFKFLTVLEGGVWLLIIGAFIFSSVMMYVFEKLSPYSYSNNQHIYGKDHKHTQFDFKECLWFSLTSLTPQGGGEPPKNISGRIIGATWWLFGFLVIASYTANLAALLTASRLTTSVKSLEDLTQQYRITYAPVKSTIVATYFRKMADIELNIFETWTNSSLSVDSQQRKKIQKLGLEDFPVTDFYQTLWQNMQKAGLPETTEEAIQRVLSSPSSSEGFAFVGDASIVSYAAMIDCRLQEVGEEISRKPYAFAVQAGSPLKDMLSNGILKLTNNQMLEELRAKWWGQNTNNGDCALTKDSAEGIAIQDVGGVFIIVLIGTGLAFLNLAWECWLKTQRKMQKTIANGLKLAINDGTRKPPTGTGLSSQISTHQMVPPSFVFNLATVANRQGETTLETGVDYENNNETGDTDRKEVKSE